MSSSTTVCSALRDLLGACRQALEDPAREDLLERAVEDPRGEARVEPGAQLSPLLALFDDPLERRERVLDLVHLAPELRAPRHLAHEHADEVRVELPRAEHDSRHAGELLARRRVLRSISSTASSIRDHVRRKIVSSRSSFDPK